MPAKTKKPATRKAAPKRKSTKPAAKATKARPVGRTTRALAGESLTVEMAKVASLAKHLAYWSTILNLLLQRIDPKLLVEVSDEAKRKLDEGGNPPLFIDEC